MFTVLVTGQIPGNGLDELKARTRVLYPEDKKAFSKEEILHMLPECDAALALADFTREMMEHAPKLKIISNYGAGYDKVDVAAAREHGIFVTNIPEATTQSTAEMALTLLLMTRRKSAMLDRKIRCGEACFGKPEYLGRNLIGEKLGIIGMGRIGRLFADWAHMLGMEVSYYNRHPVENSPYQYVSLEQLLRESDVVSLNCPLNNSTRGLLSGEKLAMMKPEAILINTARGGVVDYDALCDMLEQGKLAGAGLDVFPDEPNVPERLKKLDNVVLTPHTGTHTLDARITMAKAAADKILQVMEGRRPDNIVNGL